MKMISFEKCMDHVIYAYLVKMAKYSMECNNEVIIPDTRLRELLYKVISMLSKEGYTIYHDFNSSLESNKYSKVIDEYITLNIISDIKVSNNPGIQYTFELDSLKEYMKDYMDEDLVEKINDILDTIILTPTIAT